MSWGIFFIGPYFLLYLYALFVEVNSDLIFDVSNLVVVDLLIIYWTFAVSFFFVSKYMYLKYMSGYFVPGFLA